MEQAQAFAAKAQTHWRDFVAWATREEHRTRARAMRAKLEGRFTEHPHATGETYLEHLWFTLSLGARLLYSAVAVMVHGIFPFLCTHTASRELERIFTIMKSRGNKTPSGQDWCI